MKAAVIQSNYIPWRGYFDIMHDADVFVFYDDVQYTVNDWRNRNRVKTVNGVVWLTIPVGDQNNHRICDVEIRDRAWARKHWMTIEQSYHRASGFAHYRDFFRDIYARPWTSLSVLNQTTIKAVAARIGIRTQILDSRDFDLHGKGSDRLLLLLQRIGATDYISGPSAKSYLDAECYARSGVQVHWKDYGSYPEYPQLHGAYTPDLSIIDLLMNCGERASEYIWGYRDAQTSVMASTLEANRKQV
jgi:WbqC-like protein